MITAKSLFQECYGNEHWLIRPSIIEFAEKYHRKKLEEIPTTYTHNYETKRQTVNLGVNKESKKENY